ncbi:MAG: DUF4197 domain-containing protein [Bacteroidetes bacterium]|nr:DUF4197 domain-containing protein [Bacteroidota bacterium]
MNMISKKLNFKSGFNRSKKLLAVAFLSMFFASCDILQAVATQALTIPTSGEASSGLKDALKQGFGNGVDFLSAKGGFLNNAAYKILLPADAQKIADKLTAMGMGAQVDNVILKLNEGAENAVKTAKPIFIDAVTGMNFSDAMGILTGGHGAATNYLRSNTTVALTSAFKPKIQEALDQVGVTKYWGDLVNIYNRIPMVQKLNPDLNAFVTDKALVALFSRVEEEENAIRANPVKRGTEMMKKAFAYADMQKK